MSLFTKSPVSSVITDENGYKVDTTNPLAVNPAESGAVNFTPGQANATSVAAQILAANTTRRAALITNTDSTNTVFIGKATVTAANGHPVPAGASLSLPYTGAIYAITASATVAIGVSEVFD